jgi:hypothetical protein
MPDAVYKTTLDAVVTAIQNLSLTGIENAEIVLRKNPWDGDMLHKGITVSWDTERIDDFDTSEGTNERDMLGYPCFITIVSGTGRGWADEIGTITTWRQSIRRAFNNKRLAGTDSITGASRVCCKVKPGGPAIPKQYLKNLNVSQLTVWAWFLEART